MSKLTMSDLAQLIKLSEHGRLGEESHEDILWLMGSCYEERNWNEVAKLRKKAFPSNGIAAEHHCTVLRDVETTVGLDVRNMIFRPAPPPGMRTIPYEEMLVRAIELHGNLGLSDAPEFLAQQAFIPTKLRDKYIVLAGTVLRNGAGGSGENHFAIICYENDHWELGFAYGNITNKTYFACRK